MSLSRLTAQMSIDSPRRKVSLSAVIKVIKCSFVIITRGKTRAVLKSFCLHSFINPILGLSISVLKCLRLSKESVTLDLKRGNNTVLQQLPYLREERIIPGAAK